ncbi:MAG: hypothetical protein RSO15_04840 [Bacteroides sp.]|uniref:hypothetical protein n=1 Tax=Bacteroides sp. TaxID=29523 RepID=UPI002FCB79A6
MKYIFIFLLSILAVACEYDNNLFSGKLVRVDDFEKESYLNGEMVEIDTVGTFQIDFLSSYMITTLYKLPYFIKVYDSQKRSFLGNFAYKGNGPNEFLGFSVLNQQQDSVLWIQDYYKKELTGIDLHKSIDEGVFAVKKNFDYEKVVDPLQVFYCNDSLLLVKNLDYEKGVQYAKFNPLRPNQEVSPIFMYNTVLSQQDLNVMMSLADCLKPDGKMIASLTGVLNQIDILSLEDSTENISVKMGASPSTIEYIRENRDKLYDYYISLPRCNDTLIFALYRNKEKNDRLEFHVISWTGKALFRLFVREDLRDFNIDWLQGKLYGITKSDIVYVYDVNNIINSTV